MRNMTVICAIVVSVCFAAPAFSQTDANASLSSEHRGVLNSWLQQKPNLRLAIESDCKNTAGLIATREEYGVAYQPYYAVGDFNRDRQQDFAVVLIDRNKRSRNYAIAIFNGPFKSQTKIVPAFFLPATDLSEGGLINRAGKPLIAGVFQSDDCVLLQPRGRTYVIKNCIS